MKISSLNCVLVLIALMAGMVDAAMAGSASSVARPGSAPAAAAAGPGVSPCVTVNAALYASGGAPVTITNPSALVSAGGMLTVQVAYNASGLGNKRVDLYCSGALSDPTQTWIDGVLMSMTPVPVAIIGFGTVNGNIRNYAPLPQPTDVSVFNNGDTSEANIIFGDVAASHTVVFTIDPHAGNTCVTQTQDTQGNQYLDGPWVVLSQDTGGNCPFCANFSTAVPFQIQTAAPSVQVTVSAQTPTPNQVSPGDKIAYTVTARANPAPQKLQLHAAVPQGAQLVAGSISGGGTASGATITWPSSTQQQLTETFSVTVSTKPAQLAGLQSIVETATASGTFTGGSTVPASNTNSLPLVLPSVAVTLAALPSAKAQLGARVHYTLTVTANPQAQQIVLTDAVTLSPFHGSAAKAVQIDPTSISGGGTLSGLKVTWTFSNVTEPPGPIGFDAVLASTVATLKGVTELTSTADAQATFPGGSKAAAPPRVVNVSVKIPLPTVVNSNGDNDAADPTSSPETDTPGEVTLRSALEFLTDNPPGSSQPASITFSIKPGGGNVFDNGVPQINPQTALPEVPTNTTIDGATQGGPRKLVELSGPLPAAGVTGLELSGACEVDNLVVNGFQIGLYLFAGGNVVDGCLIGTDVTGTTAKPNNVGIHIESGSVNLVGSASPGDPNVISGNSANGIEIHTAQKTQIEGNLIGTNAAGAAALPNGQDGVDDQAGTSNLVVLNVITGNGTIDLRFEEGSSGNIVQGNLIGVVRAGHGSYKALPSGGAKTGLSEAGSGFLIGGSDPSRMNVINGHTSGIVCQFNAADSKVGVGQISGNVIGEPTHAPDGLGNSGIGIYLEACTQVTVTSNIISDNGSADASPEGGGVVVFGTGASGPVLAPPVFPPVIIQSNIISDNSGDGVQIRGVSGALVGGDTSAAGNELNGNTGAGARIFAYAGVPATSNLVEFNIILSNQGAGVVVADDGSFAPVGYGGDYGNSILQNSINGDGKLGIDLGDDGVTQNDSHGAAPQGPNNWQNFPILSVAGSTVTGIQGMLQDTHHVHPGASFTIQFFRNSKADPSGNGQGEVTLGQLTVVTNAAGVASFAFHPAKTLPKGSLITATATDSNGNTSEFCPDIQVP